MLPERIHTQFINFNSLNIKMLPELKLFITHSKKPVKILIQEKSSDGNNDEKACKNPKQSSFDRSLLFWFVRVWVP